MNSKIWLSSPHMGGEELLYVNQAFSTNWVAPLGPNVNEFEKDLAKYCGVKDAAALVSGTSAIHLALVILGVKHGDDVICQSLTFSGSANPINYVGANPIFIDSEKESWNIDPDLLEKAIKDRIALGKKPKAIIIVHLYGMPARLNDLLTISEKYSIPLIEDAAEALGSRYRMWHPEIRIQNTEEREKSALSEYDLAFFKMCGSFTDFGILSFNGNKIITTSGGGALISNKPDITEKVRYLSTQARDDAPHYQHSEIGFNYRMSNVVAGIGRGQMKVLNARVKQRRDIFNWYKRILGNIAGIEFQPEKDGSFSNRWLTVITVDPKKTNGISREYIYREFQKQNIEARPIWKPMHLQPVFKDAVSYKNGVSEDLFENGLCLPSGTNMSPNDFNRIESVLLEIFKFVNKYNYV